VWLLRNYYLIFNISPYLFNLGYFKSNRRRITNDEDDLRISTSSNAPSLSLGSTISIFEKRGHKDTKARNKLIMKRRIRIDKMDVIIEKQLERFTNTMNLYNEESKMQQRVLNYIEEEEFQNKFSYIIHNDILIKEIHILQDLTSNFSLFKTFRVNHLTFNRMMILKYPKNLLRDYVDQDAISQNVLKWQKVPFNEHILRPFTVIKIGKIPCVFIEDLTFNKTLEELILSKEFYDQIADKMALKICSCILNIGNSIRHAHKHKFYHTNLHPKNILCVSNKDPDKNQNVLKYYISDFGDPLPISVRDQKNFRYSWNHAHTLEKLQVFW
jgi:hypothetical protein